MTPKEVVLEALAGEAPARVPVALIGGGMWSVRRAGTTFEAISHDADAMTRVLVEMADVLQSDIVYVGSGYPNMPAVALGGQIRFRGVGAVDLDGPVVHGEDEFQGLDPRNVDDNEVIATIRQAFLKTKAAIGERYLVTITAWGPFTLGARIVGEETLIRSVLKNPGYVHRVLSFATDVIMRFFRPLVDDGSVELITVGDPTASGDLISRGQFERFAVPYLERICAWAGARGVYTLLHVCGDTTDRLDLFVDTGATCVSLDHKTDLAKAREMLRGRMCFAGNVDPVKVMLQGTPGDVENRCQRTIETVAPGEGFILMPGCDLPPTVSLENIQQFVKAARRH